MLAHLVIPLTVFCGEAINGNKMSLVAVLKKFQELLPCSLALALSTPLAVTAPAEIPTSPSLINHFPFGNTSHTLGKTRWVLLLLQIVCL